MFDELIGRQISLAGLDWTGLDWTGLDWMGCLGWVGVQLRGRGIVSAWSLCSPLITEQAGLG